MEDARPTPARESAIPATLPQASAVVVALTRDLPKPSGSREEYRRVPWIWRVAMAVGKSGDDARIRALLETALPEPGAELTHWQAVVIGGGLINGITEAGRWPDDVIRRIVGQDETLAASWRRVLAAANRMANDQAVPAGTRYDALRIVALQDWTDARPVLERYLAAGVNGELQLGAISGLADAREDDAVVELLVGAFDHLARGNVQTAVQGLLRNEPRVEHMRKLARAGRLPAALAETDAVRDALGR
jgi:hypothetical protein